MTLRSSAIVSIASTSKPSAVNRLAIQVALVFTSSPRVSSVPMQRMAAMNVEPSVGAALIAGNSRRHYRRVMAKHTVTLIPGDGIGPEVCAATQQVIEAAGVDIAWEVQE